MPGLIFLNFLSGVLQRAGSSPGILPMYAFPVTDLAERLDALLELADIDEVIITRAGADNLVLADSNEEGAKLLLCRVDSYRA